MLAAIFLTMFASSPVAVAPANAAIALTATSPVVSYTQASYAVAPASALVSLTATSPTLTYAPAGFVAPANATLSLTATSPTITTVAPTFAVAPASATIGLTATQPTLSYAPAGVIAPASATLSLTATSPVLTATPPTFALSPAPAIVGLSATSPTLTYTPVVNVAPSSAVLALFATQPTISYAAATYSISPASVTLSLKSTSPVLDGNLPNTHAPISIEEAKVFLRVETDDDDALIGMMIDAAAAQIETICGVVVAPRVHQFTFEAFDRHLELLLTPVRGIDAIDYIDTSGADQTIYGWQFRSRYGTPTLLPEVTGCWPLAGGGITVTAQIGYETNADVPAPLRLAAQVMVTSWYQAREVGEVPAGVLAMLSGYRAVVV